MSQGKKKSWPDRDSNAGPLAIRATTELLSQWSSFDICTLSKEVFVFDMLSRPNFFVYTSGGKNQTTKFTYSAILKMLCLLRIHRI